MHMSYLLEDVMENKVNRACLGSDLWEYVEDKETIEYNTKDVKHWIYKPCWSYMSCDDECFISIYQVIKQPHRFEKHNKRIIDADISYPLIVIEDAFDEKGSILDGNHRFAKLLKMGVEKIKIKYISRRDLEPLFIDA